MKRYPSTLILLLLFGNIFSGVYAQTITTLTGGAGAASFGGDGGAQFSGSLQIPGGVYADNSGNIYIADGGNYRIRKVDTSGIITTIGGNGGSGYSGDGGAATLAQLQPFTVFVDASGNILFGDTHNNAVRKINRAGIIYTIAGTGTAGYTGDGGPATAAQINAPSGVVEDAAGNIYFSDATFRLRKISASGIISTFCGTGTAGFSGDGGQATAAKISTPGYMHMDNSTSTLYFVDNGNNRIRKISLTTGIISTVAGNGTASYGGDGGTATAAQLHGPGGITMDASGNLYIADNVNDRVRMVNTSGIISTYAGSGTAGFSGDGGPATAARLHDAIDVSIDVSGHLLIADNHNNRIRIIDNPCAGTPSGGTISATVTTACTTPFNSQLTATGFSITPGVTYYWQSSPDSINWTIVPGAIGVSYSATVTTSRIYYRFVDSCTVSGLPGRSAGIKLGVLPISAGVITGSKNVCIGANIALTATVSGGSWSAYNGSATVSSGGVVHGVSAGLDIISYTITNVCDTVSAIYPITIYTKHQCDSALDVNEVARELAGLAVRPNPAFGSCEIEIPAGEAVTVAVTDIMGKVILQRQFGDTQSANVVWRLPVLPAGTYIVRSVSNKEMLQSKFVILE